MVSTSRAGLCGQAARSRRVICRRGRSCSKARAATAAGEKNSQYLYVLWEYDRKAREWRELARVWAESWEWALELGPLARRALEPVRELPDLRRVGERLAALIERELEPLEARQRAQVAGVLHDQFAARMVAWAAAA